MDVCVAARQEKTIEHLRTTRNVEATLKSEMRSAQEAFREKNRSHHQAIQARRGQRSAPGSWTARHYRHRSQGVRAAKGPRRALSRRGVHCRLSAQGEDRDRDLG